MKFFARNRFQDIVKKAISYFKLWISHLRRESIYRRKLRVRFWMFTVFNDGTKISFLSTENLNQNPTFEPLFFVVNLGSRIMPWKWDMAHSNFIVHNLLIHLHNCNSVLHQQSLWIWGRLDKKRFQYLWI